MSNPSTAGNLFGRPFFERELRDSLEASEYILTLIHLSLDSGVDVPHDDWFALYYVAERVESGLRGLRQKLDGYRQEPLCPTPRPAA